MNISMKKNDLKNSSSEMSAKSKKMNNNTLIIRDVKMRQEHKSVVFDVDAVIIKPLDKIEMSISLI